MKYIQLMCGDETRDFSQVMLDFGVAIVGPGFKGDFIKNKSLYTKKDKSKIEWLTEVKEGDRIVMKMGQYQILAVGEVVKNNDIIYQYSTAFSDIDGWDLSHFCYVEWRDIKITLEGRWLSRATAQYLYKNEVKDLINDCWDKATSISPRYAVPESCSNNVTSTDLEKLLIECGLKVHDSENTIKTISTVQKLAEWYQNRGEKFPSSEHEIRAFLVLPLFHALGWSHQRISVERYNMDIVLYEDASRKKPKLVIETKSLFSGSRKSKKQVAWYLAKHPEFLKTVNYSIVTDGVVYWMMDKSDPLKPLAYMNLIELKETNVAYPEVKGILTFIKNILP